MEKEIFQLKVMSRDGIVFEGKAKSISSFNEKGKFDVLAEHANFISLITNSIVIRTLDEKISEIKFSNALLRVRKNIAEVYIGVDSIIK